MQEEVTATESKTGSFREFGRDWDLKELTLPSAELSLRTSIALSERIL